MKIIDHIQSYDVILLDKQTAQEHVHQILDVLKEIQPFYLTETDVLSEEKDGRTYTNKWEHSVLLCKGQDIIAVLIAYERASDGVYYREPTLYLHHLAIQKKYQGKGLGTDVMSWFLKKEKKAFPKISLQTNAAEWNVPVQQFYEKLGFTKVGKKPYNQPIQKIDIIYQLNT